MSETILRGTACVRTTLFAIAISARSVAATVSVF
jgi:hypothetical protein